MMISYAQNREDVLLSRCFPDLKNGFYVDVGAAEPETDSVTKHFYELGWWGINLEPVARFHAMLQDARPRDVNLNMAAGATSGEITFYEIADTGLSTTVPEVAQHHAGDGREVNERSVPVKTLDAILDETPPPQGEIHFLKIDVEGAEEAVLRGLTLSRNRPWIILLEATEPNTNTFSYSWEPLLLDNGYQFGFFDGINRYYVSPDHPELMAKFDRPVNFLDDYESRDLNHFRRTVELRDNQLNAKNSELLALYQSHKEVSDRLIQAEVTNASQQSEITALSEHVSALLTSFSWRITTPLRVASRIARWLIRLPRRILLRTARFAVRKAMEIPWARSTLRKLASRFPVLNRLKSRIRQIGSGATQTDDFDEPLSALPAETSRIYQLIKRRLHENRD